jgi:hypothetical protein
MLAVMVLMFIAIDVIILLVYDIYSATQGTLEAILLSNREKIREEIGVRYLVKDDTVTLTETLPLYRCKG